MLGFQDRSQAAILQLVGLGDQIRKYEEELRNAGGITEEVSEKQLEGFNAKIKQLGNAITNLQISIGEAGLLDFVADLVKSLTGFISRLSELNPAILKWGTVIAGVVAAIGPALIALGLMLPAITAILAKLAGAGGLMVVLGKVGAVIASVFTFPAGVIALAVAGIAVFVANSETARDAISKAWNWIKNVVVAAWEVIKDVAGLYFALISELVGGVAGWLNNLVGSSDTALGSLMDLWNWFSKGVVSAMQWTFDTVAGYFSGFFEQQAKFALLLSTSNFLPPSVKKRLVTLAVSFQGLSASIKVTSKKINDVSAAVKKAKEELDKSTDTVDDASDAIIDFGKTTDDLTESLDLELDLLPLVQFEYKTLRREGERLTPSTKLLTEAQFELNEKLKALRKTPGQVAEQIDLLRKSGLSTEQMLEILASALEEVRLASENLNVEIPDSVEELIDLGDAAAVAAAETKKLEKEAAEAADEIAKEAERMARVWEETMGNVVASISENLTDALFEAKNFADGMKKTFKEMAKGLVQILIAELFSPLRNMMLNLGKNAGQSI